MIKNKLNNKKKNISIVFCVFVGIIVFFAPLILIPVTLGVLYPTLDVYLLTGLVFFILINIIIIVIPAVLLLRFLIKNKGKGIVKKFCKDHKVLVLIVALLFIFLEITFVNGEYIYYKDIKEGPQEAIMTDAVIEIRSNGSAKNSYLVGYIDGVKTSLDIIQDAGSAVSRGKIYKRLRIKYYKNIGDVFEVKLEY